MKGKFYSIGMGPGDRELITIKALNTIDSCDVIAVPVSGASKNVVLNIAGDHVEGKEILYLDMPMTRDKERLEACHEAAADLVGELLEQGKNVGFLTLGDPAVYSSTMYVHNRLKKRGYNTVIIPGITSFSAAAAALDESLCEGEEALHIIPGSYGNVDYAMELSGNKIFMKSGKSLLDVKESISKHKNHRGMMVEKASMEDEKIYRSLDEIEENTSYFSLVLVKEEK